MSSSDFARAWDGDAPSALHIDLEPDANPDLIRQEVQRALGRSLPLTVETLSEREQRHYTASRDGLSRLRQIGFLVLGAAVLAMATAMAGVLWQRRSALAGIKVNGIRESTLWSALLLESAALLGTGCVAGAVAGLGGQVILSHALEAVTGFPVFYSAGALTALAILAAVLAVALLVLTLPGWLVVRVPPAARPAD
jgi:predicted lysophospholipase L1 biosynthesis ABC-type transport system permease subunit